MIKLENVTKEYKGSSIALKDASAEISKGEDGKMPRILAAIHPSRQSPFTATLAVATVSVVIIVALKNIAVVANLTNFTLLAAFAVINTALVVLRYREPNE